MGFELGQEETAGEANEPLPTSLAKVVKAAIMAAKKKQKATPSKKKTSSKKKGK